MRLLKQFRDHSGQAVVQVAVRIASRKPTRKSGESRRLAGKGHVKLRPGIVAERLVTTEKPEQPERGSIVLAHCCRLMEKSLKLHLQIFASRMQHMDALLTQNCPG